MVWGVAVPTTAIDGLIEINAAAAIAGGITPGDSPGYPVTIGEPGSYKLTGTLSTSTASATLIEIAADNVTLDLNGFGLEGPAGCTGYPVSNCTPSATGFGIRSTSNQNVRVHDGWIRGLGEAIELPITGSESSTRIERVRAIGNAAQGLTAATVIDCEVIQNAGDGITARHAARNIVKGNSGYGIRTPAGATRGVIRANEVDRSGQSGIRAHEGAQVADNVSSENAGDGIEILGVGQAHGNIAIRNGGFGLNLFSGGYSNNVFQFNNPNGSCLNPQVSGAGIDAGSNTCCGGACP
jgi:hypothetical protein